MTGTELIRTSSPRAGVRQITLARAESRNAQSAQLLYDLNAAFDEAASDTAVRCVVLAADGPHFSAGHDLRDTAVRETLASERTIGTWTGFEAAGAEGVMCMEHELYLGMSERWRNLPKPTIAAVQGKVIAGGLILAWVCDLLVAADDAQFVDITVEMGIAGAEYFQHPWELPPRIAKEMLFASRVITADEALRWGMANHVVSRDELLDFTLDLAERIAGRPGFALGLAKESVNRTQDAQGRPSAMATAFAHHQLGHSHYMQLHGTPVDPAYLARFSSRPSAADRGR